MITVTVQPPAAGGVQLTSLLHPTSLSELRRRPDPGPPGPPVTRVTSLSFKEY